jgi:hypothetical protein
MYILVTEQKGPKHVELRSSKVKNIIMNNMIIVCILLVNIVKIELECMVWKI